MSRIPPRTIALRRRGDGGSRRAPWLHPLAAVALAGGLTAGAVGAPCSLLAACPPEAAGRCPAPAPAGATALCEGGTCPELSLDCLCAPLAAPATALLAQRDEWAAAGATAARPQPAWFPALAAPAGTTLQVPPTPLRLPAAGLYTLHASLLI